MRKMKKSYEAKLQRTFLDVLDVTNFEWSANQLVAQYFVLIYITETMSAIVLCKGLHTRCFSITETN